MKFNNIFLAFLFTAFVTVGVLSVQSISITYDEAFHFQYGLQMMHGNTERTGIFGDSNMPILAFNALPFRVGELLLPDGVVKNFLMDFNTARYVTIIFSAFVGLLIYHWARSLYGLAAAIFSLIFYLFDPNIIAHSQLITTDIYAAGVTLLVFYCLWRFARERTIFNGVLLAFALGFSQLAKYSTIVLLPLAVISLVIYDLASSEFSITTIKKFLIRYAGYFVVAVVVITLMINVGFFFNHTLTPFGKYKFRSDWFRGLKDGYPVLHTVPVPFPYPYLDGLDWMRQTEVGGKNSGTIYLLGKLNKQGFPGYYIVAALLKFPISTQIAAVAALALYFSRPVTRRNFFSNEVFMFVPILFFFIYFNFLFRTQIGIRYYLVIFPLMCVFMGSLFGNWREFGLVQKTAGITLVVYLVLSIASYYPFYLTYFNEIVWDRNQAYRYLADSNIDWGQSNEAVRQYLAAHPDAVFEPPLVQAGHLVVEINHLVGVTEDPLKYAWLRETFEPVATINNSVLVYKISQAEIDTLCRDTQFCE